MLNYFFKIFSLLWGSKKKFMLPLGYSVCTWRPVFLPIMVLHVVVIIKLIPVPTFFFFFLKLLGRDRHWLGWLSTCQWQDLWLSCLLIWEHAMHSSVWLLIRLSWIQGPLEIEEKAFLGRNSMTQYTITDWRNKFSSTVKYSWSTKSVFISFPFFFFNLVLFLIYFPVLS